MIRLVLSLLLAMTFASAPVFQAHAELTPAHSSPGLSENVSHDAMESMEQCDHCDKCDDRALMPECATPCLLSCTGGFWSAALPSASSHYNLFASDVLNWSTSQHGTDALLKADPPPPRI